MKRKKMTKEERVRRLEQKSFFRKIYQTFTYAGFAYVKTNGVHFSLGGRDIEIDAAYVYENIVLLCEDTIEKAGGSDHVLKKEEAGSVIEAHKHDFLVWFGQLSPDARACCHDYKESRIRIFNLYFSKYHTTWSDDEHIRYSHLKLVSLRELDYFKWMSQSIRKSSRYEIYKYLGLETKDVGTFRGSTESTTIETPIVYPSEFVGGDENIRVVSFMMAPGDLLRMAYVMRKDGWRSSGDVYQRLVDKTKIKKIREYLCRTRATFYNNIIVALPDSVKVVDANGDSKNIFKVMEPSDGMKLSIIKELNSIGIIDGQHRVYAYYEGGIRDTEVEQLREQLRLLVTGIAFPSSMKKLDRQKVQSSIFLDINENAKPVNSALMLHIKRMQNPFADTSIAQDVIERMNSNGVFKDHFQESMLSQKGIPTASVIKFALRYLVSLSPSDGKGSFVRRWDGDVEGLTQQHDNAAKDAYVKYCAECLNKYFAGIKAALGTKWDWEGTNTLLPSVVTINGFLIAYGKRLLEDKPREVDYYKNKFKNLTMSFSRANFKYRSSQYHKFAAEILEKVWG